LINILSMRVVGAYRLVERILASITDRIISVN